MKFLAKTCLVGGFTVAFATHAAALDINVHQDAATAQSNYQSLLDTERSVTEDFNDLAGTRVMGDGYHDSWEGTANSYDTSVGTFTLTEHGQPASGNENINNLMIESNATGEFGRSVLADDDLWLDSNDAKEVVWDLDGELAGTGPFDSFGFQLADAADVSADLTLHFADGEGADSTTIPFELTNGNVRYVSLQSDRNIVGGQLTFDNSTLNDGWGIDNVTVGKLPEPGSLLLMGLGLLGLGAARRRTK